MGRNFETFDTLEFLVALSTHIPARNRKFVIYYGFYSQPARGKHIHSPPSIKPCKGPIIYESFFDDLPEDEQVELIHASLSDELKICCGEDLSEEVYLKPVYKKDKISTPKDFP